MSEYDSAFDGDDLQNFSDQEAWEDAQADMRELNGDDEDSEEDFVEEEDGMIPA